MRCKDIIPRMENQVDKSFVNRYEWCSPRILIKPRYRVSQNHIKTILVIIQAPTLSIKIEASCIQQNTRSFWGPTGSGQAFKRPSFPYSALYGNFYLEVLP